jgi:hypothetical protein
LLIEFVYFYFANMVNHLFKGQKLLTTYWANACYSLWMWRNKEQHEDNFLRPTQPVSFVLQRCREYCNAVQAKEVMAEKPRRISWVGWKPPDVGWIKLNTDGACKEAYASGCGGILRNNNGE